MDGRKLNVQRDYGPKKSKVFMFDNVEPSTPERLISDEARAKRRQEYLKRVTSSSKGMVSAVEVKGDDKFGIMPRSVWADLGNAKHSTPEKKERKQKNQLFIKNK
jgi:hypothetical protein